MIFGGPVTAACKDTGSVRCQSRLPDADAERSANSTSRRDDMKKTICAMKAALGVRGLGGCLTWRWVYYHNI